MPRTQPYPEAPEGYQFYGPDDAVPLLQDVAPQPSEIPSYDATHDQGFRPQPHTLPMALSRLLGSEGQERFQTWPEKMVRDAVSAPNVAYNRKLIPEPTREQDYPAYRSAQNEQDIQEIAGANAMANLAMGGGMPMAVKGALGSAGGKLIQPSLEGKAPRFYSALEHAVNSSKQNSASPDQWLATIRNTPGVKQEELQWSGLEDFLKSSKNSITKEQIEQHLAGNKLEVKDALNTNKTDSLSDPRTPEQIQSLLEHSSLDDLEPKVIQQGAHFNLDINGYTAASYGTKKAAEEGLQQFINDHNTGKIENIFPWAQDMSSHLGSSFDPGKYSEYQLPGGTNYNELLLTLPTKQELAARTRGLNAGANEISGHGYQSPHWDEPNVLAHVRFNDRTINGKKSLFMEEVQSDWHQTGRKQGYSIPESQQLDRLIEKMKEEDHVSLKNKKGKFIVDSTLLDKPKSFKTEAEANDFLKKHVEENYDLLPQERGVPDAPFKKTWPELVLKRMIRHAAENGYDSISWTPGEVQAKRWAGTGEEGHQKFYDEIMVNAANKLAKPFQGKVNKGTIPNARNIKGTGISRPQPVHILDITPVMHDAALKKGFPLFSGGHMLVPIDGKPELEDKHKGHMLIPIQHHPEF